MMSARTLAAIVVPTAVAFSVAAYAADDSAALAAGRDLARGICSDCHGVSGNPTSSSFPKLAAQPLPYLIKQLREFQGRHRVDDAARFMWGEAGKLNDERIHNVALYFSKQKATPGAPASPEVVLAGSRIFQSGIPDKDVPACSQCHGDKGQGSAEAEAPRLAGQWSRYLLAQLKVFSSDQRPAAVAMHAIVPMLSSSDIEILAEYLQALRTE